MSNKIYLCGRISGRNPKQCKEAFASRERYWTDMGFEVINPITLTPYVPGKPWEDYMKDCLGALVNCDYIAPEDGWMSSKGSCLEMRIARELKIRIIE